MFSLVCEALPILLKRKVLPIQESLCYDLLKECIQFFASLSTYPEPLHPKRSERLEGFASCSKDPWNFLVKILHLIADRLEWRRLKQFAEFRWYFGNIRQSFWQANPDKWFQSFLCREELEKSAEIDDNCRREGSRLHGFGNFGLALIQLQVLVSRFRRR